ncbi:MAG: hypothetical protein J6L75_03765 [Alistipes sp.]|nr:hypothetical protein [Alistipes sp.]
MKRLLSVIVILCCASNLMAQVAKQVEVSKDYTPTVSSAQKLALIPDMTDTVKMQPEIDYTITPRTYATSLMTPNFRPATIAYWDYKRMRPLYVKAAFGVPLSSEADAYLSTYNKDRGYAMVYANHWGDYRNRKNLNDDKVTENTSQMSNRVGGRAGLFVGRHVAEIDLYGDHQMRHRYPTTGAMIGFGEMQGKIRFGDDFTDLKRWNFNIEAGGGFFSHQSRDFEPQEKFAQSNFDINATVGKMMGRGHVLKINAGYSGYYGGKMLDGYKNNSLTVGMRYGFSGRRTNFIIGADYYHDKVELSTESPHYVLPYMRLTWKRHTERFVPYIEIDSDLRRHNFAALIYENPYLITSPKLLETIKSLPNEVQYNGRVGIGGNLGKGVFSYNLSAALSFANDHAYWYANGANYLLTTAYQHSLRIDGGMKIRPAGWFEAELTAGVYAWENYGDYYANRPNFDAALDLRVITHELKIDINFGYAGGIKWMTGIESTNENGEITTSYGYVKTNNTFSLGLSAEWRVCERIAVFAEGRNLTGSRIYEWLNYYQNTPQGLLGVKMTF